MIFFFLNWSIVIGMKRANAPAHQTMKADQSKIPAKLN
jgi:hypothetical protein